MNTTTTEEEEDDEPTTSCCNCMMILSDTVFELRIAGSEAIDTSSMCDTAKEVARQFNRLFKLKLELTK